MAQNAMKIDETEYPLALASPFTFHGVHSDRDLSGFELDVTAFADDEIQRVEDLVRKRLVSVEDPFTDRRYEATVRQKSYSYQEGRRGRHYRLEVKELDAASEFRSLEIEEHTFRVIKNTETVTDETLGLHILLRLTSEEFERFHSLLTPGAIKVRRIGIDDTPIVQRFGGALYWSSHKEGDLRFYKQIVRFYPTDPTDFPPAEIDIASGHEQRAQAGMILALSARYEALVELLIESGQISRESGNALMSEEWRSLIDQQRTAILRSKLMEVDDAEPQL